MAPSAMLIVADGEPSFTVMDEAGNYTCPHCGYARQDQKAATDGESSSLGKAKSKKVDCTLLVHPEWLRGCSDTDANGDLLGGSVEDDADSTTRWHMNRSSSLTLIEVRGCLPEEVTCPDTQEKFSTGKNRGNVPGKSKFKCRNDTCGREQDILTAVKASKKSGPFAAYAIQAYCPSCCDHDEGDKGKYFDKPNARSLAASLSEWAERSSTDLASFFPHEEIPYGYMTGMANGDIRKGHGFTHWRHLFNPRQLLVHSQLLKALLTHSGTEEAREVTLGVFQQYLRNQNMFCFWNMQRALEPMFSNNNYHPKSSVVENSVFPGIARGDFKSSAAKAIEALEWNASPWEIVTQDGQHSTKIPTGDALLSDNVSLSCGSASALTSSRDSEYDLVITDPPFGGLLHYSELADFFYVWLRVALSHRYPEYFNSEHTPKALEAVANRARNPDDADQFYQKLLTECWREAYRVLKPGGILAFTFHHSDDEPWVAVLESLFNAGFILEATYPIRSDETKGEGEFGSKLIEFDIVHVCRKRLEEPEVISWARLRRQIMRDVRQLREIIEQHEQEGLGEADLQVIRRGKALEYYSRHYGKVYIEKGREDEFTVKDALVGINQLLDDESDTTSEAPPVLAEPYTRQFLRLFADKDSLERDQMQKYLRGTGVSPSEFLERSWCSEEKKVFTITAPLEWAQQWKGKARKGMSRDFDQTFFLIGACYDESGIKLSDTLNSGSFVPHPAISDLLDWFGKHGSDSEMKAAARRAKQIYSTWLAKNTKQVSTQRRLFDLEDGE
jgi:putative DNA methylase